MVGRFLIPIPPDMIPVYICKADNNGTMYYFTDINLEEALALSEISEVDIKDDMLNVLEFAFTSDCDNGNLVDRIEDFLSTYKYLKLEEVDYGKSDRNYG